MINKLVLYFVIILLSWQSVGYAHVDKESLLYFTADFKVVTKGSRLVECNFDQNNNEILPPINLEEEGCSYDLELKNFTQVDPETKNGVSKIGIYHVQAEGSKCELAAGGIVNISLENDWDRVEIVNGKKGRRCNLATKKAIDLSFLPLERSNNRWNIVSINKIHSSESWLSKLLGFFK